MVMEYWKLLVANEPQLTMLRVEGELSGMTSAEKFLPAT